MSSSNTKTPIDPDRDHEAAKARAELLRRAEVQGVKPFTSLEDFAGEPELTADFDVEEFLRQVREDRDRPGQNNAGSTSMPPEKLLIEPAAPS